MINSRASNFNLNAQANPPDYTKFLYKKNNISVPFEIVLKDFSDILRCETILRHIPGKRLFATGIWHNKPVIAKIYQHSKRAMVYVQKELEGVKTLVSLGIPTPKLLWQGTSHDETLQVLIFERIMHAVTLEDIWQSKKNIEDLRPILRDIIIELSTQHVLGVIQKDLHMKNLLITSSQIYTINGHGIQYLKKTILPKKQSLELLALFYSQLGIISDNLQKYLFETYANARGWLLKKSDIEFLQQHIIKWQKIRWQRYAKKIYRTSTQYARVINNKLIMVYDKSYHSTAFQDLLNNPDYIFSQENVVRFKTGNTNETIHLPMDNHDLIIKKYNLKKTWWNLSCGLQRSKAATIWNKALKLYLFGIPAIKPVAFVEKRFLGWCSESYFIMENITGTPASHYFVNHRVDNMRLIDVAERMIILLFNLAKLNLAYNKLEKDTFVIVQQLPIISNIDDLVEHPTYFGLKSAVKKELIIFLKSWEDQPQLQSLFKQIISKHSPVFLL